MRKARALVALLVTLAFLAAAGGGCGSKSGGQIEGVRWILQYYNSNGSAMTLPAGTIVDALFENGTLSGFSGVNDYSGTYKLSGSSLTVGKVSSTLMAGPQELMDLEQAYLKDLAQVSSYSSQGGTLTLIGSGGRKLLGYGKGVSSTLSGGTWNAVSYYNGRDAIVGVIAATTPTAVFQTGGSLFGSDGVNDFRATYSTSGQGISIKDAVLTTDRTIPDPVISQQAKDYLAALQLAKRYSLSGSKLELYRSNGSIAASFQIAR